MWSTNIKFKTSRQAFLKTERAKLIHSRMGLRQYNSSNHTRAKEAIQTDGEGPSGVCCRTGVAA